MNLLFSRHPSWLALAAYKAHLDRSVGDQLHATTVIAYVSFYDFNRMNCVRENPNSRRRPAGVHVT